jgi:type VI secretion system secreted protein Hcp
MLAEEMRIAKRIGRPGRAVLLVAVGAAGGGAALAVASVPDGNGVVHACVVMTNFGTVTFPATGPNVRIIDPNVGPGCTTTLPGGAPGPERTLNWNTAGPQGLQGPQGPAGNNGSSGHEGAAGATNTIAAGHTFTISGGQVITVGDSAGLTIAPPRLRNTDPRIADVVLKDGKHGKNVSFNILASALIATGTTSATGGGSSRKVQFKEVQITKVIDKSSPALSLACAGGHRFSGATFVFKKGVRGGVFQVYRLESVIVSSYQLGPSGGGDATPQETLTLSFGKIAISTK